MASFSTALAVSESLPFTSIPLICVVLMPGAETETWYLPALRPKTRYSPCALVLVSRCVFVARSRITTVALGTTAPVPSVTRPAIVPRSVPCAKAKLVPPKIASRTVRSIAEQFNCFMARSRL